MNIALPYFKAVAGFLALAAGFALLAGMAHAQASGFGGGGGCGTLFTPDYGQCSDSGSTEHIFSNFVCQYQKIISEIMSQMYCGVTQGLMTPFGAVLTLFVTFFGAAILIGMTPFTATEVMRFIFKIGLVVAFATQADFMIDVLYKGVIGFMSGGVDLVMQAAGDQVGGSANGLLDKIDEVINKFLKSASLESAKSGDDGNQCNDSPVPLFVTFLVAAPPLFALAAMMVFKLIMVFIRAVVGYLFALTIIMFLVTLSPIFLSLGLFRATRSFFEKWVGYLMSMAVQVVVVFAFIGFVFSMGIEENFQKLVKLSVPFNQNMWMEGTRADYKNWCTFCKDFNSETMECNDKTAVPPSGMWRFPGVLKFMGTEIFKLLLLALLVEATLNMAPEVARQLGGVNTAPSVAGKQMADPAYNIQMAGGGAFSAAGKGFMRGGLSGGYSGLMHGSAETGSSGIITDFTRSLVGVR